MSCDQSSHCRHEQKNSFGKNLISFLLFFLTQHESLVNFVNNAVNLL